MLATLAVGGVARAAAPSEKPQKPEIIASGDLQKLIDQFNKRRETMLADRDALVAQLKNATDEQRKAILEKMQALQKDQLDAQRALAEQIRDEMRKLRRTSGPGSR